MRAFGRTQVHRLTDNVKGLFRCWNDRQRVVSRQRLATGGQAESSQQAEVGNGRTDWIGRQRVVSRQRSGTGRHMGR